MIDAPHAASFGLVAFVLAGALASMAACGGHRRHHTASACPDGTSFDGASCAPLGGVAQAEPAEQAAEAPPEPGAAAPEMTCPGGSVVQGDGCACPDGTAWIAEQCQVPPAAAARPVSSPRPRRRSAFIPAVPQAPAPPSLPVPQITPPTVDLRASAGNAGNAGGGGGGSRPTQSPPPSSGPPPTVTHAACTNGMIRTGDTCHCPQGTAWEGNACLVPCHPTQRRDGTKCVCPKDTRWNGSSCELWQECRGGQVHLGASCICPSGTTWTGTECRRR
jgi:hypothetical protein